MSLKVEEEKPPSSTLLEEAPPSSTPRHPFFENISLKDWTNWHWQARNSIRKVEQLAKLFHFSEEEEKNLEEVAKFYRMAIPPYYLSLANPSNPNDPIKLQAIPSSLELIDPPELSEDPLEEDQDSPVPGLTHRYPDRALILVTPNCPMYCRFCTRKRITMKHNAGFYKFNYFENIINYLKTNTEIREVIVSGGDPLSLPYLKLEHILQSLTRILHIEVIRIGTRIPVTLPQKLFDKDLITLLEKNSSKLWINTHFNHPREVTREAALAIKIILRTGIPVNNQTVLLKGVNDSLKTVRELCLALLKIKVRPYYLFHCDPVKGATHFRTSIAKGIEIIEGLRGHISGLGVPTYVIDAPHGGGKIPLMPNYLISLSDDAVILRNYEGMIIKYHPEEKRGNIMHLLNTTGVSELLEGEKDLLVPIDNKRMERRKKICT